MHTRLQYQEDSGLMETRVRILGTGADEPGFYFIPDKTIFYPGGGGQPPDEGWLISVDGNRIPIFKGINDQDYLKHYLPAGVQGVNEGSELRMGIDPQKRLLHARIHTGGHLVSSVVSELLKWPLIPVKGYHYPDSPYVELLNPEGMNVFPTGEIDKCLTESIKQDLPVHIRADGSLDRNTQFCFIPPGFPLLPGKILRWVGIGDFRYYPCGGTHTTSTGVLTGMHIKYCKSKKGNIRIAYQVD